MSTLSQKTLANAVRFLSMDAVQKANSGHPGMPMGMADIAQVLWMDFFKHCPGEPQWFNRDRFVVSNGHGSMLLYSLLHLSGYDLSIDDLKAFRQLNSKTPGHPEFGHTPGVDTTTGPLGNGIANAVGMALAERTLAAQFNRPGFELVDHHTYVFLGDGCLMEGLSHEACAFAGTQKLGKLIAFWDDNGISIDGEVGPWFSDNTPMRFEAYGWHVIAGVDGHDPKALHAAIVAARAMTDKPTLICCKTTIGFGAPTLAGSSKTHGSPLGAQEIQGAREQLQWPYAPFEIPDEIYQAWDATEKGHEQYMRWEEQVFAYEGEFPELGIAFMRRINGDLPDDFEVSSMDWVRTCQSTQKSVGTRKSSQLCIETFSSFIPELLGGSADLGCSNLTTTPLTSPITPTNPGGNYFEYGVREFGMSSIMNGLALHGGLIPFGGTFLVFSDYARNAVRLSALMHQRVIYVYTHDSIGVGEDGPTHQPIEQLASLRLIPNIRLWRPCDTAETAVAWQQALMHQYGPTILALSRQNTKPQPRDEETLSQIEFGGYTLFDCKGKPELIIMATGSEVEMAVAAYEALKDYAVRVVSMPCMEVFKAQDEAYQDEVLPRGVPRVAIEAGSPAAWFGLVRSEEAVLGLDHYGYSAPGEAVYQAMGLTHDAVMKVCLKMLKQK